MSSSAQASSSRYETPPATAALAADVHRRMEEAKKQPWYNNHIDFASRDYKNACIYFAAMKLGDQQTLAHLNGKDPSFKRLYGALLNTLQWRDSPEPPLPGDDPSRPIWELCDFYCKELYLSKVMAWSADHVAKATVKDGLDKVHSKQALAAAVIYACTGFEKDRKATTLQKIVDVAGVKDSAAFKNAYNDVYRKRHSLYAVGSPRDEPPDPFK